MTVGGVHPPSRPEHVPTGSGHRWLLPATVIAVVALVATAILRVPPEVAQYSRVVVAVFPFEQPADVRNPFPVDLSEAIAAKLRGAPGIVTVSGDRGDLGTMSRRSRRILPWWGRFRPTVPGKVEPNGSFFRTLSGWWMPAANGAGGTWLDWIPPSWRTCRRGSPRTSPRPSDRLSGANNLASGQTRNSPLLYGHRKRARWCPLDQSKHCRGDRASELGGLFCFRRMVRQPSAGVFPRVMV
jgi:hypothetical protein